jgi:lipase chaperone LimK
LEESVAALRANGGGDDAIYRLRTQAFDTAAADRFADLDREEAQWKTRIENYLGSRAQLLGRLGDATASERQAAVTELQQNLFTEMERKRLAAYEP